MKFAIVLVALFAVALAHPVDDQHAQVVSQSADIAPDHSQYNFAHQSDNGISASESGTLRESKSAETNEKAYGYATQGEFSYTGPDGQVYSVKYTADENGFHPEVSSHHIEIAIKRHFFFCDEQKYFIAAFVHL